jgi:hypothetical protein
MQNEQDPCGCCGPQSYSLRLLIDMIDRAEERRRLAELKADEQRPQEVRKP